MGYGRGCTSAVSKSGREKSWFGPPNCSRSQVGSMPLTWNDSSGDFFEMAEAEGLDHLCLHRRDRKSVVYGNSVDLGGRRIIKKNIKLIHELADGLGDIM